MGHANRAVVNKTEYYYLRASYVEHTLHGDSQ